MASAPAPAQSSYVSGPWLVAFVVMGGVLLLVSESPKYGDVASGLAVLIAVGSWTYNYAKIRSEINALFSTNY